MAARSDDLSKLSRSLSKSSKAAIKRLQQRAEDIDTLLGDHLKAAKKDQKVLKPGVVQSLITSEAIALDKQLAALRTVRDLEQTAGDTIEATFIVIEVDSSGGRRVVGVPPELAGVVPLSV
jgi:alpha-D-ribose 1-methylphosphonate 5-triphosphate synthase subunit PhnI